MRLWEGKQVVPCALLTGEDSAAGDSPRQDPRKHRPTWRCELYQARTGHAREMAPDMQELDLLPGKPSSGSRVEPSRPRVQGKVWPTPTAPPCIHCGAGEGHAASSRTSPFRAGRGAPLPRTPCACVPWAGHRASLSQHQEERVTGSSPARAQSSSRRKCAHSLSRGNAGGMTGLHGAGRHKARCRPPHLFPSSRASG